jgi:hypothetical protein
LCEIVANVIVLFFDCIKSDPQLYLGLGVTNEEIGQAAALSAAAAGGS